MDFFLRRLAIVAARRFCAFSLPQVGQPCPFARVWITACHWCPLKHIQATFLPLPGDTVSGVRGRFARSSQSGISSGLRAASDRSELTWFPAQYGQPLPLFRLEIAARHSCPSEHFHHTFRSLPAVTAAGVSLPFFIPCHSGIKCGQTDSSDRSGVIRFPAQNRHPFPRARLSTFACHSCPSPHIHQYVLPLWGGISAGVRLPLFRL